MCLFGKIIFVNLFYYSAYFLLLFMGHTVLFQLTFTFIYSTFSKKFSVSYAEIQVHVWMQSHYSHSNYNQTYNIQSVDSYQDSELKFYMYFVVGTPKS